jgi:hypothetical protein
VPGFPIRTPWDHSLVDSSPRPIAASHVLHRLLVPRHSPFALDNLTTKMLASTVQFSTNDQPTTHKPHTRPGNHRRYTRPGHAWQTPETPQGSEPVSERNNQRELFFQDPTGCYPPSPSRTTKNRSIPPEGSRTKTPQPLPGKNSPVSPPLSTPTRHPRAAGSLHPFR